MPEQCQQQQDAVVHFFLSPFQFLFKLSPDGLLLAYIWQEDEQTTLKIDRIDTDLQRNRVCEVAFAQSDTVLDLEWKTSDTLIIVAVSRLSLKKKLFSFRLSSSLVDLSGGSEEVELAALLPAAPEHILVYDKRHSGKTIGLLNITTLEYHALRACADDEVSYFFDWSGQLRLIWRTGQEGYQILMPDAATQQFTPVFSLPFDGVFIPLFISTDLHDDFYALTNADREFTSLARVRCPPSFTIVCCETGVDGDIAGITGLDSSGNIEGVIFATARQEPLYFTPGARQLFDELKRQIALPLLSIKSVSADKRRYIVAGAADAVPESSFLYDSVTGQLTALGCSLPDIDVRRLCPMTSFTIKSFDGTSLPCFLTLPKTDKPFPLILFPHAGPWANDSWGFNAIVQCFASAGYAVLQVNFRGSTGYGRSFIRKSIGHWGDDIQQDITAALRYVMANFPVDEKRVFGFGTSFGGLTTLLHLARGQTQFAGAVTLNAPTDLQSILQELPALWLPLKNAFYHLIADPHQPDAATSLKNASPLFLCDLITAPVLLLHSENDQIVTIEQSRKLYESMRDVNRDCQFVVIPEEGHDVLARENIARVIAAALSFFNTLSAE